MAIGDVEATPVRRVSPPARVLLWLIHLYQKAFAWRPSPCRYVPSCSNYALDAVEYRGAARGSWLAVRRLGRCHPWGGSGWDPVPGSPLERVQHPLTKSELPDLEDPI